MRITGRTGWLGVAVLLAHGVAAAATISVFAGGGSKQTGPATECLLADPFAIDFDARGQAYLCEMTNNRVLKVSADGQLTLFSGTTRRGAGGDGGPATNATLNGPHHLLVHRSGDVFIADTWNWKIRRISARSGVITTLGGTGRRGFSGDGGPATQADFSGVYCLALDAAQENLFFADLENRRVRAINLSNNLVRTIAGTGEKGVPTDGSLARLSPLVDPRAVTVAANGDVYILERGGHALRVVDASGHIRTVVGTGRAGGLTSTTDPRLATLSGPKHLWAHADGSVLIADSENHAIRRYWPGENRLNTIVGTGRRGSRWQENPLETSLQQPHGVSVDARGRIYIADSMNSRVLRLEP